MSVTKIQPTKFHDGTPKVKFRSSFIRLEGLDEQGYPNLVIRGGMSGRALILNDDGEEVETEGVVETINGLSLVRSDVASLPTAEKQIIQQAVAILERELSKKAATLKDETHDATDVMA
jgi:hypothetical protein